MSTIGSRIKYLVSDAGMQYDWKTFSYSGHGITVDENRVMRMSEEEWTSFIVPFEEMLKERRANTTEFIENMNKLVQKHGLLLIKAEYSREYYIFDIKSKRFLEDCVLDEESKTFSITKEHDE